MAGTGHRNQSPPRTWRADTVGRLLLTGSALTRRGEGRAPAGLALWEHSSGDYQFTWTPIRTRRGWSTSDGCKNAGVR